ERPDLAEGIEKLFRVEKVAAEQFGVSLIEVTKTVPVLGQAFAELKAGHFERAFALSEEALKKLDPVVRENLVTQLEFAKAIKEVNEEQKRQADTLKFNQDVGARLDAEEAVNKEATRKGIEAAIEAKGRELDLNVLMLRAAGLQDQAHKLEIQNIIALN